MTIFLPTIDDDENEYCYICSARLTSTNQRDAWVSWADVTQVHICDDPGCAEDDEIFTDEPTLVTCDGWLEAPDETTGDPGIPCREEFFASRDRPTCPVCCYEHAFAAESEATR